MKDIEVRAATLSDLGQLIEMQVAHRKEIDAYALLTFDKELCTNNMATVINSENNEVTVATHSGSKVLLGYMWITAIAIHYSPEYYYADQYTYVLPSSRGGIVLSKLIKESKRVAKNNGGRYLHLGSFSGNEALVAAYSKRYPLAGYVFNITL